MPSNDCPQCGNRTKSGQNFCHACGAKLGEGGLNAKSVRRRRARRIAVAGQLVAGAVSGIISGLLALILAFYFFSPRIGPVSVSLITPTPFGEETSKGRLNASAILPLADSSFLVVDDLTDDAFYDLRFDAAGKKAGPMQRLPIAGLERGHVEDFEGATLIDGKTLIAVSSLEQNEGESTDAGLVRIVFDDAGSMRGETMDGFRAWLVATFPEISAGSANMTALNVGGIVWDAQRSVLRLGIRYPAQSTGPYLLAIRVKDVHGAWKTTNLERVGIETFVREDDGTAGPKGVLDIARLPSSDQYVVILGDSTGKAKHAALYVWDGANGSLARKVDQLVFNPEMKPEGIAFGSVAGKPSAVLVDDTGGYYVIEQADFDAKVRAAQTRRPVSSAS